MKIANLKCQGCVNNVINGLMSLENVDDVKIDLESSELTVLYQGDTDRSDEFAKILEILGYPMISKI